MVCAAAGMPTAVASSIAIVNLIGISRGVPFARVSIVRRAELDPAADDVDLSGRQVGAELRHSIADNARGPSEFLNQIAAIGIARNDANGARLAGARALTSAL